MVRLSGDPEALVPSLRTVLSTLEPGATLDRVTMLPGLVAASLARDRFTAFLMSSFAGLAVRLSAVGVFGVISTETARRRKEIGIRMAIGALALLLAHLMGSVCSPPCARGEAPSGGPASADGSNTIRLLRC